MNLVEGEGLEPSSAAYLAPTGYKSAALPLSYPSDFGWLGLTYSEYDFCGHNGVPEIFQPESN